MATQRKIGKEKKQPDNTLALNAECNAVDLETFEKISAMEFHGVTVDLTLARQLNIMRSFLLRMSLRYPFCLSAGHGKLLTIECPGDLVELLSAVEAHISCNIATGISRKRAIKKEHRNE